MTVQATRAMRWRASQIFVPFLAACAESRPRLQNLPYFRTKRNMTYFESVNGVNASLGRIGNQFFISFAG